MPDHHYVKVNISLRDDVYTKLMELVEASGLSTSAAVSLALVRLNIEQVTKEPIDRRRWELVGPDETGSSETPSDRR
ncbi:MAG: hypothetical protein U0822_17055 [Anaerolineae bacterium]